MDVSEFGAINCVVGTIVWVRRRNGSWWPGKILGSEELSASHLLSPRSGTPVKLLGREDASVDWYNLEKSKRVKAFRCGEFNDCIERAESSHGIPSKKREKYARREDAILHALELEKQSVEKKHSVLGTVSECRGSTLSDFVKRDPKKIVEKGKCVISKSEKIYKRMDFSYKDDVKVITHGFQNFEGNKLRFVDDTSEAVPRMRFLQDFGLRIASPKQKNCSLMSNGVGTNHAHVASFPDKNKRDVEGLVNVESLVKKRVKQTEVVYRAKRSKCIYVEHNSNESMGSPKMQIEMSPSYTKEGNSEHHLDTLMKGNYCQHTSNNQSNYSQAECLNPEIDEAVSPTLDSGGRRDGGYVTSNYGSLNRTSHYETGVMCHPNLKNTFLCGGEGMSEWKIKGKRNSRGLNKRLSCSNDISFSAMGSTLGPSPQQMSQLSCTRRMSRRNFNMFSIDGGDDDGCDIDRIFESPDIIGSEIDDRVTHLCLMPENPFGWNEADWEPIFSHSHHPFVDQHHHYHHHIGTLFQVDLRVQSSHQKEQVPIVSLMSRLNGKAIIGHPIQIQILADRSSDKFFSENIADFDTMHLPSMWRTARRTANPVRHPRKSSEPTQPPSYDSLDFQGPGGHQRAATSQVTMTSTEGNVVRKVQKKVGWTSQKTRTLSSIATQQHEKIPESAGFTTMACVPVKIVFTRIFEGISRPISR